MGPTQDLDAEEDDGLRRVGGPVELQSGDVHMRILLDHSCVEVYLGSGEVLSTRIYRYAMCLASSCMCQQAVCKQWKLHAAGLSMRFGCCTAACEPRILVPHRVSALDTSPSANIVNLCKTEGHLCTTTKVWTLIGAK